MRIAIAGGNSFIGRNLTRWLLDAGHDVAWLSHRPGRARELGFSPTALVDAHFDPGDPSGPWRDVARHADAVVNLSGYPIVSRWTARSLALIRESRIATTRALVDAIGEARSAGGGPSVLVNASGAGIYGDRGDEVVDERTPATAGFLGQLAQEWEAEAMRARDSGARVVVVRTPPVLGEEGFLPRMALPMRLFAGGPIGSGAQWLPWIHIDDIAAVYHHAIETATLDGPVDAVAGSIRMRDFARALGGAMRRPSWFPVPVIALRVVLGPVAPYIVESQRIEGARLREGGFAFAHPELEDALRDAIARH